MKEKFSYASIVIALLLAACGGGGGGSTSSTTGSGNGGGVTSCTNGGTNPPTCTPPVSTSTQWEVPVTTVPAPTYASGSANLALFTMINQVRGAAGAGLLTQNTSIDTAAAAYSNYVLLNEASPGFVPDDGEVSTMQGYTGASAASRMTAAGYVGNGGQDSYGGSPNPVVCMNLMMGTVYHRLNLLQGWVNVGLSFVLNNQGDGICVMDFGTPATFAQGQYAAYGVQIPAAPVVYPYSGQTLVGTTFLASSEAPNPAPDLGYVGTPITVSLATQALIGANLTGFTASEVTITGFTLTAQGSATPLAARIITAAGVKAGMGVTLTTDVNNQLNAYVNCLLPLAPLSPKTTYNAVFTATVNGQAVNLSWSFTTGTPQADGTII